MLRGSLALLAITACAAPDLDVVDQAVARKAPSADVDLDGCDGHVLQSADTTWSLTKTGSIDPATRTVTWTVNATASATPTNHLVLAGSLRIKNTGDAAATIGNIIVNLQDKGHHGWETRASDIANATS